MSKLEDLKSDDLVSRILDQDPQLTQNSQALLIAQSLVQLRSAVFTLVQQIPITGSEIRGTISRNTEELKGSVNDLTLQIKNYSDSSNKYAIAMKSLTKALVFFTAVQAVGIIIQIFTK